ncbi:MAG: SRPBCC family protein [Alphaproteobacteria bacterium]
MQKEIYTEIIINQPMDKVWEILTDFDSYPKWNPFIVSCEGQLKKGEKFSVSIKPEGQKPMGMKPVIIHLTQGESFIWHGKMFFPCVFEGKHSFALEKISDNQTRFIQSEKFSGIFATPILKMVGKSTVKGFEAMNQALKQQCEKM